MKKYILFILTITLISFSSCKEEEPELGSAPTSADAEFTYSASSSNPNVINFKSVRPDVIGVWDFDNGRTGNGVNVTSEYIFQGSYNVTLTVFTNGGSASASQLVEIAKTDTVVLNDPLFRMLTGGISSTNGKTWVIDSANTGHFGVTYSEAGDFGYLPNDYSAAPLNHQGMGMYDDRYNFNLFEFKYNMITNGDVFIDNLQGPNFPGSTNAPNSDDFRALVPNQLGKNWSIEKGTDTTLVVTGETFLGFYTGVREYKILNLSDNELYLRYRDASNSFLQWYLRLIPEGFVPAGPKVIGIRCIC